MLVPVARDTHDMDNHDMTMMLFSLLELVQGETMDRYCSEEIYKLITSLLQIPKVDEHESFILLKAPARFLHSEGIFRTRFTTGLSMCFMQHKSTKHDSWYILLQAAFSPWTQEMVGLCCLNKGNDVIFCSCGDHEWHTIWIKQACFYIHLADTLSNPDGIKPCKVLVIKVARSNWVTCCCFPFGRGLRPFSPQYTQYPLSLCSFFLSSLFDPAHLHGTLSISTELFQNDTLHDYKCQYEWPL